MATPVTGADGRYTLSVELGTTIDQIAIEGDPTAIAFPRAILDDGYDFSFSGVKTAVVNYVRKHPDAATADVAASFQEAVVDVLSAKVARAAREFRPSRSVPEP